MQQPPKRPFVFESGREKSCRWLVVIVLAAVSGCNYPQPESDSSTQNEADPEQSEIADDIGADSEKGEKHGADDRASLIVLNQVGYYRSGPKKALLMHPNAAASGDWQVVSVDDGEVVLSGNPGHTQHDTLTGFKIADIDFSSLSIPGRYQLIVAPARSLTFTVSTDPYQPLLTDLFRSFYLQRCGVDIDDQITDIARAACHLNDADYAHADIAAADHDHEKTTGGWHDAGDYGKYVATTAITISEILSRFEQFPATLSATALDLPESGNAMPDVLDEMKVGLDWLVSMQRSDGALYRKLSGKKWPELVPPAQDLQPRYLYGSSTSDTAKAVASFAIAARVFFPYDTVAAGRYLAAARLGWRYLSQQPDMLFDYRDGDDSGSGPYRANDTDVESSLRHDRDDRLAAAIELYLSTGEDTFIGTIRRILPGHALTLYEWKDPATQSLINFYWHPRSESYATLRDAIKSKLLARAREALSRASTNVWQVANTRFIWGSNKMAAQEGVLLLQGWRLTADPDYRSAAIDQLDYLLGRNPNHRSYVTGTAAGERSVRNIAHIYVRATGKLIPGLLVGGPNIKAQAKIAPADKGPMSYIDDARSYATNEYAIDYTSALIALLLDLQHVQTPLYVGGSQLSKR